MSSAAVEQRQSPAANSYLDICQELGCAPVTSLLECLRGAKRVAKLSHIRDAEQLYAATSILPFSSVEELDLSGLQWPSSEQWTGLLEACSRCTGLRVLSIKGCGIGGHGPDAEEQVARQLGNCSLAVLEASQNHLGDTFLAAFSRSPLLREAEVLTMLDLSENCFGDNGIAVLAATLETAGLGSSLKQLDLSFNRLGDSGARAVASMMAAVPLLALELEGNQITDAGGLAVAEAMKSTLCLQRLNLNNNALSSSTLSSIAESITVNIGNLQELAVSGSTGSEQGVAAVLAAACKSKKLHMLDVRGIPLEGQAVDGLCDLLASSCPLATLRLDAGSREAAETIARALPTKPTLLHFMMGGNVPEHVLSFIATALSANTLHKLHAAMGGGAGGVSSGRASPASPQREQQQQPLSYHRSPATAPPAVAAGGRSSHSCGPPQQYWQSVSPACYLPRSNSGSSTGGNSTPQRMQLFGSPLTGLNTPRPPQGGTAAAAAAGLRAPSFVAAASGRSPGSSGGSAGGGSSSGAAARAHYVRSLSSQAKRASVLDPQGLAGLAGGGAANKAAEVFKRHDLDGSGSLDAEEMMSALQELGMLEGMRPRQLGRFLSTAIREADTDRDGLVSMEEFTSYYERLARHYAEASRQGRISARRRAPEVPLEAPSDESLRRAHRTYCRLPVGQGRQVGSSVQHINAAQFNQLCRDVGLLEPAGPLSQCAIDIVFTRCKPPGSRRLPFRHFLQALAGVADEAAVSFADIAAALASIDAPGASAQQQQMQQLQTLMQQQQQQQQQRKEAANNAAAAAAAGAAAALPSVPLSRRHSLGSSTGAAPTATTTHTRLSISDLTNTRVGPRLPGRSSSAAADNSDVGRVPSPAAAAAAAAAAVVGDTCYNTRALGLRRPASAGAGAVGVASIWEPEGSTPARGRVSAGVAAWSAKAAPWTPPSRTVTPWSAGAADAAAQAGAWQAQQEQQQQQQQQDATQAASGLQPAPAQQQQQLQQSRMVSGRNTVQNPLFEGESEASLGGAAAHAASISHRLEVLEHKVMQSRTPAGTEGGLGTAGGAAAPGVTASSLAGVESRVAGLEACVDEMRSQLAAGQAQQDQLKGLLGRLLEGLEAGRLMTKTPEQTQQALPDSATVKQLQQLTDKVDSLTADVAAAKDLQDRLDKLAVSTDKRHTRVETAIYQVAHQVDLLDTRVKQEQQSTLRALQSLVTANLSPRENNGRNLQAADQPAA